MKDSLKLVASLSFICLVCAFLVAAAHDVTLAPIAAAEAAQKREAILAVLPAPNDAQAADSEGAASASASDGDAAAAGAGVETKTVLVGGEAVEYFETASGRAIEVSVKNGYSGEIRLMLGFSMDGKFWSYKVLSHAETPGLGAHIEKSFIDNVRRRDAFATKWKVVKDGGDIVPITAATISSRAVCGAIERGVEIIKAIQQKETPQ